MRKFLTRLFPLFLLISCPMHNFEQEEILAPSPPFYEEAPSLFFPHPVTGEIQFSINTPNQGLSKGATYWRTIQESDKFFEPLDFTLRKSSGHSGGGYGFFFAQQDEGSDSFSALAVFINILGEYCTGVIHEKLFDYILPWTDEEYLIEGYGQNNHIRIEPGILPGQYRLYINNNFCCEWEDPSNLVHDKNGYGYLAVVTPLENFPSVPVMISFSVLE